MMVICCILMSWIEATWAYTHLKANGKAQWPWCLPLWQGHSTKLSPPVHCCLVRLVESKMAAGYRGHHPSTHQDFLPALADRSMTMAPFMKPVGLARTVCPGGMTSTLEGAWDLRNLLPLKQYVLFDKVNSKTIQIQRSNLGILGLDFEGRHWGGPLHDWRTGLGMPGGDSKIGLRFPQPWISFRSTTPCDFKSFFGVHIFCNPCIWDMWWSWRFRGFKQLVWNGKSFATCAYQLSLSRQLEFIRLKQLALFYFQAHQDLSMKMSWSCLTSRFGASLDPCEIVREEPFLDIVAQ